MLAEYTEEEWAAKLEQWTKGSERDAAIIKITNGFFTIKNESIRRKIAYLLGIVTMSRMFVDRFTSKAQIPLTVSPALGITNDYTSQTQNNQHFSTRLAVYNFIRGCIINNTSAYYKETASLYTEKSLSDYLHVSQDFIIDEDKKFINYKIYQDAPIVTAKTINSVNIEECDEAIVLKAAYQVLATQQHISHLGIGHLLPVHIYNVFNENKIFDDLQNNNVMDVIKAYGSELRSVTEGFGKVELFNSEATTFGIDNKEIPVILNALYDVDALMYKDLDEYLVLDLSKKVYLKYRQVVNDMLYGSDIYVIRQKLHKSRAAVINCIVNFMYSASYHHNKSHSVLQFTEQFTKNKFAFSALLNQLDLASKSQVNPSSRFLIELKKEINKVKDNEGEFICNAHQYISFF